MAHRNRKSARKQQYGISFHSYRRTRKTRFSQTNPVTDFMVVGSAGCCRGTVLSAGESLLATFASAFTPKLLPPSKSKA